MPQITEKQIGPLHFALTCTLAPEEYMPVFEKSLKKYQANGSFKGFRKGKAPLTFVKKMVGESLFLDEVAKTIDRELDKAIKEKNLSLMVEPIPAEGQDALEPDMTGQKTYEYTVEYALNPTPSEDYSTIQLQRPVVEIKDTDLEDVLSFNLNRLAASEPSEVFDIHAESMAYVTLTACDEQGVAIEDAQAKIAVVTSRDMRESAASVFENKPANEKFGPLNVYDLDSKLSEEEVRSHVLGMAKDETLESPWFNASILFMNKRVMPELTEELMVEHFGESITSEAALKAAAKSKLDSMYEAIYAPFVLSEVSFQLIEKDNVDWPIGLMTRHLKAVYENMDKPDVLANSIAQMKITAYQSQLMGAVAKDLGQSADVKFEDFLMLDKKTLVVKDAQQMSEQFFKQARENRDEFQREYLRYTEYLVYLKMKSSIKTEDVKVDANEELSAFFKTANERLDEHMQKLQKEAAELLAADTLAV